MKVSLSTACLYVFPLWWTFALAKHAGFDGVELVITPEVEWRGGAYVRKLAREFDLPVLSVHPPMFGYRGWEMVNTNIAPHLTRAIEITQDVGAPILVIHMPRATDATTGVGREFVEEVVGTRNRMNGRGPRLSLENRARFVRRDAGYILTTPPDLRAFADAHDFGLTLDTSHLGTFDLDLCEAFASFRGRLANVHLSDLRDVAPGVESRPVLHSYVKQHQFPGEGKLPLTAFLRMLAEEEYQGPITYELSPTALSAWNPWVLRKRLAACVEFVRQAVQGK